MQRKILLVLAMLVLGVSIYWLAGGFVDSVAPGQKAALAKYKGETIAVNAKDIVHTEHLPGTIIAKQNTQISSRILATIEQMNVRSGATVQQGQVLVELDSSELETQLAQAQARVRALDASLAQAKKQLARAKELFSQGLIAVNDLDTATATHDNLLANLQGAEQQLAQAKVGLSYSIIVSPIDGVVVERFAEPGDTAVPGTPVLSIYNPQQLQAEFAVREQRAVNLQLGDELTVTLPSIKVSASLKISELIPAADSASRSLIVRLEGAMPGNVLPGLYAQLSLENPAQQVITVKPQWLRKYGQLSMLYVLNDNSQVTRRYVRTGATINGEVEVLEGLAEGDIIAVQFEPY